MAVCGRLRPRRGLPAGRHPCGGGRGRGAHGHHHGRGRRGGGCCPARGAGVRRAAGRPACSAVRRRHGRRPGGRLRPDLTAGAARPAGGRRDDALLVQRPDPVGGLRLGDRAGCAAAPRRLAGRGAALVSAGPGVLLDGEGGIGSAPTWAMGSGGACHSCCGGPCPWACSARPWGARVRVAGGPASTAISPRRPERRTVSRTTPSPGRQSGRAVPPAASDCSP